MVETGERQEALFDRAGEREQFNHKLLVELAHYLRVEAAARKMEIREVLEERLVRDISANPCQLPSIFTACLT